MTEKEVIERCKKITTEKFNLDYSIDNIDKEAIETVLNLLEKKNRTIQQLKDENRTLNRQAQQYFEQGIKKDKMIDLIANYIVNLIKYNNPEEIREVEEIKQYFERKVENGN